jgi:hypothetical protein
VYAFQPRAGWEIGAETRKALAALDVHHNAEVLNTEFSEIGVLNKVFVCARAEEILSEETLVFLDSDTFFTAEPADLDLAPSQCAAVRPAESAFLNSTGPTDPHDVYWQAVYRAFGIENQPYVETEFGRRVRAFFSAGLIAVRREAGLFREWRRTFQHLASTGLLHPETGLRRMDEIALAAVLTPIFDRVKLLDGRYNYLIYRRALLAPQWRQAQLSELAHIHYRDRLERPGFLESLDPPLEPDCEILTWLREFLPMGQHAVVS